MLCTKNQWCFLRSAQLLETSSLLVKRVGKSSEGIGSYGWMGQIEMLYGKHYIHLAVLFYHKPILVEYAV